MRNLVWTLGTEINKVINVGNLVVLINHLAAFAIHLVVVMVIHLIVVSFIHLVVVLISNSSVSKASWL